MTHIKIYASYAFQRISYVIQATGSAVRLGKICVEFYVGLLYHS